MSSNELSRTRVDFAEVTVNIVLSYVVFKIAAFLETLSRKVE